MYIFNNEQLKLKEKVRAFVEAEVIPEAQELDKNRIFPLHLIKRCGELGLVSDELRQDGKYKALELCMILEELARGSASLALALLPHYLVCDIMNAAASPDIRKNILEPASTIDKLLAYAISEESGGSDVLSIDTTAIRLDDEWVLNGGKAWITSAGKADGYLIAARTARTGRSRNISLFYVDASADGLTAEGGGKMIGLNACPTGRITLENCRIPRDNMLGEEDKGYALLMPSLQLGRLAISAIAAGISSRALELANNYAAVTEKYGRSLSSYQGISFMLADMYAKLSASRSMLYCAAAQYDANASGISAEIAAAKLVSTELACEICKSARQIHGANGLSSDFEVDRCFRDAQMLTIAEGTSEICKIVISNHITSRASGSMI